MKYVDILNRMGVLGDALQLRLHAKAMAETLMLRAHYAKGMRDWQTKTEQVQKDTPRNEGESDEDYLKRINDVLTPMLTEDAELSERRYTAEAFVDLCGIATQQNEIASVLVPANEKKEPGKLPSVAWLDWVAANLVTQG